MKMITIIFVLVLILFGLRLLTGGIKYIKDAEIIAANNPQSPKVIGIIYTILGATILILSIILFTLLPSSFSGSSVDEPRCTICKDPASHTFQGYSYCTEHYEDAIIWAYNNVKNKN